MKAILSSLLLASAAFAGTPDTPPPAPPTPRPATPQATLKVGDEVKIDALTAAKWIQGEMPKSFEPGKVYLFECWATWCAPCVAAIPHVNELHKTYHDKGLRVYGMNVWEDDADKVAKFVTAKGEGMSYPVAFTGRNSAFENTWLKAAGVRGIPHAFVVKDGKLVLDAHPSQLTNAVIEALLKGDDGAQKVIAEINAANAVRTKVSNVITAFRQSALQCDTATMAAKISELETLDAHHAKLPGMRFDLLLAKKDWPAASKAIGDMPPGQDRQMIVLMTATKIGTSPEGAYPVEFIHMIGKTYAAMLEEHKTRNSPMEFITLAYLQWKGGDKSSAASSANMAAELAAKQAATRPIPTAPFERFAKAVADGSLPTHQDFSNWTREALKKNAPPVANPKLPPAKAP